MALQSWDLLGETATANFRVDTSPCFSQLILQGQEEQAAWGFLKMLNLSTSSQPNR